MNTPKRVSFGSTHGSMVETLIIDDLPNEEKSFYQDTLLQHNNKHSLPSKREDTKDMNSPPEIHVTFANNNNVTEDAPCQANSSTTTTTTTTSSSRGETDSGVVLQEQLTEICSYDPESPLVDLSGDSGGGGGGGGDAGGDAGGFNNTSRTVTYTATHTTTPTSIIKPPTTSSTTQNQDNNSSTTQHSTTTTTTHQHVVTFDPSQTTTTPDALGDVTALSSAIDVTRTSPSPSSPTSSLASSTPGAGKKPGPPIIRINRTPRMADETAQNNLESQLESQIESQIVQTETTTKTEDVSDGNVSGTRTTTTTKTEDVSDGNVSGTRTTVNVVEKRHIIVDMNGTTKKFGTDSHENPFMADGELSKKAEYILRHSTISRSEIRISDPDLSKSSLMDKTDGPTEESPLVRQETVPVQCARAPELLKENGKVGEQVTPQNVQVEVGTANASQPQPQQAEQVKLKEPKCKCCVVM